jgi:hypothetical protein
MEKSNEIIYELLFGDKIEYKFDISDLDIENYLSFIDPIVEKVNKGGVKIIKDFLSINGSNMYWEIKIKRD